MHRFPPNGPVMLSFGVFFDSGLLEQTVEQTVGMKAIWDTMALMWRHCSILASSVGVRLNIPPSLGIEKYFGMPIYTYFPT